jgi:hypothetical protein
MPLLCGVAHNTMKVYEREKRNEEVWTEGTEELKRLIEYTKRIGLFHRI